MAQVNIQEFRIVYPGTTMNTAFVAADNDAWGVANATKLRITSIAKDGLTEVGIPDETMQTRLRGKPDPLVGLREGSLKVTTYLGGGSSTTTADPYATLLSKIFGGITTLTAKTQAVTAGCTTTNIVANSISTYLNNGQGVLINNEARIAANVQTNHVILNMALSAAPSCGDTMVLAHTVYSNESASVDYIDWLAIGKSTADQRQGIGSVASATITGTAPGEAPKLELEFKAADHQWVASGDRASLLPASAPSGNDPPTGKNRGGFFIADTGTGEAVARATMRAGQFSINPNITWNKLEDPNGPNGIGGWFREPSSPTCEFTVAYDEDMLGLRDDFEAGTAKMVMIQLGTQAAKCVMIYLPKAYLDSAPTDSAMNNEAGVKCTMHGDDDYDSASEIMSSAMTVHYF